MDARTITITHGDHWDIVTTHSEDQTSRLAAKMCKAFKGGEVLALSGELGAGKTAFVKGIADSLGIQSSITSPTFVVMKVYAVPGDHSIKTLCHIDAYRLESGKDLEDIGIADYLGKPGVLTVIEWAERVESILPPERIWLQFEHGEV